MSLIFYYYQSLHERHKAKVELYNTPRFGIIIIGIVRKSHLQVDDFYLVYMSTCDYVVGKTYMTNIPAKLEYYCKKCGMSIWINIIPI